MANLYNVTVLFNDPGPGGVTNRTETHRVVADTAVQATTLAMGQFNGRVVDHDQPVTFNVTVQRVEKDIVNRLPVGVAI